MSASKEINRLNEEAWRSRTRNRENAEVQARQVLEMAQIAGNRNEELMAMITLADGACFNMRLDDAQRYLETIKDGIEKGVPRSVKVRYMYEECYYWFQRGELEKVIESGQTMLKFIGDKDFRDERSWVLVTTGIVYQRMGETYRALTAYREAESLVAKQGKKDYISNIRMSIGVALCELGKKKEALEMLEDALNLRLAVGGGFHLGLILGNIGKTLHQMGEYAQAVPRWEEAVSYFKEARGMPFWAHALAGRADALRALGQLKEAEEQLQTAISESEDVPEPIRLNIYLTLSRVHADTENWQAAIESLKVVEGLTDDSTDHSQHIELHSGFHQAYKALGDSANALHHLEQVLHHRERNLNQKSVNSLAEWETHYQVGRLREKVDKLSRNNKQIEGALNDLSLKYDALLVQLSRSDALVDEMLTTIPTDKKTRYSRLIRAIRKQETENDPYQTVRLRIAEAHPVLSPTELKICSMIAHGWTSKEIAEGTRTTEKNIEKHRTAIRRKMEIPQSVSLQVYLAGIAKTA